MKKALLVMIIFLIPQIYAQNSLRGVVQDEHSGNPVPGVNIIIEGTLTGTATDINGEFIISNIPDGPQTVIFSHIGFRRLEMNLTFNGEPEFLSIKLREENEETEEIFVNATRLSRTIEDEPIRTEVIAGEEIDEKISMDPSNISMMLNESTGIQVQQTSAASANNSFRIQGLDGRYTQLLKDGFPLYSGFAGSLSIVQIPPLDLKQIEIIKGSSSVLYGGGAIAGLINLITKEPSEEREISFLLNGTSALGLDASGFYSEKFEDFGLTLLASQNYQRAYDSNDDQFSDIPDIRRYSLNPKLYFYPDEDSRIETGFDLSTEERTGGSIPLIRGNSDSLYTYKELNKSTRLTGRINYLNHFGENQLSIKLTTGYFDREILLPDFRFKGEQISSYGEASYLVDDERSDWIFGANFITENFTDPGSTIYNLGYNSLTFGLFLMNSFSISSNFIAETGLRTDYDRDDKWFILPNASFLIKLTDNLSGRIGGGAGYKIPSIFNESSEEISFRNVMPLNRETVKSERSWGFNFDVNYRKILFDELVFSINQLFFYTRINDPLILDTAAGGAFLFRNIDGYNHSRGGETNLKLTLDHLKLFAGYSFTEVTLESEGFPSEQPLTPKHRVGIVLIYEEHENFRVGLEAYYTGKQKLSSGDYSTPYWINGLMIEKHFSSFSLFLNFENFLDVKQADYGPVFTGSPASPVFAEIYAPAEGRVINGGIKLRL